LLIKLSQAAYDQLKAVNQRFPVEILYWSRAKWFLPKEPRRRKSRLFLEIIALYYVFQYLSILKCQKSSCSFTTSSDLSGTASLLFLTPY
jgi:hypothetical protein